MKFIYILFAVLITSFTVCAAPPTIPTSNLSFLAINGASLNIGWTAGNGTKRIIIARAGSAVTAVPQNGIDYNHDNNFGSGDAIAPGQFVIYDNAFTSFFLTGLTPGTQYFFAFFEYNGAGTNTEYLVANPLTGSCSTSATPTLQTSNMVFSNITANTATANFTAGNGARRLILLREGSAVNADPVDLQSYGGTNVFGTGTQIGTGNYVLYSSSGTSTVFTNLNAGITYHVAAYEYNGLGEPVYMRPAYRTSFTTRTVPTIPSSGITATVIDGKELSFDWTSGNGLRRIIVAKAGSPVTALPADGTTYTANPVFGNGTAIAPGEFVVYDGNFHGTIISGLNPATVYHIRIFEYDGNGTNNLYLRTAFGEANASTAVTPSLQASAVSASNITATSMQLNWTNGNGKGRFILARKNAAVNVTPQDFTTYDANSDFGMGQQIGAGNYVLGYVVSNGLIVHNLEANTTYHFALFEYNGLNQPLYRSPAATFSATTTGVVPVKLSSFTGAVAGKSVRLKWITEVEINTSHFTVLRSTDGRDYAPLKTIGAAGNSQLPVTYSIEDFSALTGSVFYKLEITDNDGKTAYSPVIQLFIGESKGIILKMSNPDNNTLQVHINNQYENLTCWSIINAGGQLIGKNSSSQALININISNLPSGMYWLVVANPFGKETRAFIRK
jgi:hypothetical protein